MELAASPARSVSVPVLLAGIATTVLALALRVWLLDAASTDALLFVVWYVLPIGAYVVGVVAGVGYGAASWATGTRITGSAMAAIAGIAVVAFAASQIADYLIVRSYGGALPSFGAWFDAVTREIAFTSDRGPDTGPVGVLGYGVMLAVMVGFVLGSITVPAVVRAKNYCAACGTYMRSTHVGTLPASVKGRMMLGKSADVKAEYEAEQQTAFQQGTAVHDHLFALAGGTDADAFAETARLANAGTTPATKLPTRLRVDLAACPQCRTGVLSSQTVAGQGRQTRMTDLATAPVAPDLVRALRG